MEVQESRHDVAITGSTAGVVSAPTAVERVFAAVPPGGEVL